jgi:hypothetical protein
VNKRLVEIENSIRSNMMSGQGSLGSSDRDPLKKIASLSIDLSYRENPNFIPNAGAILQEFQDLRKSKREVDKYEASKEKKKARYMGRNSVPVFRKEPEVPRRMDRHLTDVLDSQESLEDPRNLLNSNFGKPANRQAQ